MSTKEQVKRAASQWARDYNYGHKGVEYIMTAWFGTVEEFNKISKKVPVSENEIKKFEEKYLFKK
jgi:hypothetical protein